jgi:nucleoside phosphorylase
MASRRILRYEDYTVGWICALPIELSAAIKVLDEEHYPLPQDATDPSTYTFGRIGKHNIVIACLPVGQTGTNAAAVVAERIRSKFKFIRFGLLVGIGGGVPGTQDIRLGDVVVSQPNLGRGGVVQYDFGKSTPSGFKQTGFINTPPAILLNALAKFQAMNLESHDNNLSSHTFQPIHASSPPPVDSAVDYLFEASYNHVGGLTCEACNKNRILKRPSRKKWKTMIHYGTIASGNQVVRDGATRDRLSSELGGVLCFEMEAAGVMNIFPCLVIRGICGKPFFNFRLPPCSVASLWDLLFQ